MTYYITYRRIGHKPKKVIRVKAASQSAAEQTFREAMGPAYKIEHVGWIK